MSSRIETIVEELAEASSRGRPVEPLTERYSDFSLDEAYAVQRGWLSRQVEAGDEVVGRKVGLTSQAMQEMLGVSEPDYGVLLRTMMLESGAIIESARLIAPRVEPEVAFYIGEDLQGAGVTSADVLDVTERVAPALEVIDSRIADWRIKLADTVADNASSAMAVVGPAVSLDDLDLAALRATLIVGTEQVTGIGSAVLGHPAEAVAWLVRTLARYGEGLRAGDVVLPGAMTKALPVQAGDHASATFDLLPSVEVSFS